MKYFVNRTNISQPVTAIRRAVTLGLLVLSLFSIATAQQPAAADQEKATDAQQLAQIVQELQRIRQLLENQQAPSARALVPAPTLPEKVQMSVGSGWNSIGRDDAPLTLVEFVDYQCPFCKRFHGEVFAELKKDYIDTGKLRFVSRDLPLAFHPYARKAAEAARCAGDQQKYWELHDALMAHTSEWDDQTIHHEAERLSLDMKRFQACLESEKYKTDVQQDATEAAALQINGTPTFVLAKSTPRALQGTRLVGAQPFSALKSAIDALLINDIAAVPHK